MTPVYLLLFTLASVWVVCGWGMYGFRMPAIGQSRNEMTRLVVDLLLSSPDWKVDAYYAKHAVGLDLWIANGWEHARYTYKNREFSPSRADRLRIWKAYKSVGSKVNEGFVEDLARSIIAHHAKD